MSRSQICSKGRINQLRVTNRCEKRTFTHLEGSVVTGGDDPEFIDVNVPNSLEMTKSSSHALSLLDVPDSDRVVEGGRDHERFPVTAELEIGLRGCRGGRGEVDVADRETVRRA